MKTVIVVREDLDLPVGKWIAQAVHASSRVYSDIADLGGKNSYTDEENMPVCIVCSVKTEEKLLNLYKKVVAAGVPAALQVDAGHNYLHPGTTTVLCIGPGPDPAINKLTKRLRLYR